MGAMISQTWAVPKAKLQSAWSTLNFLWRNLPKGWGSPTLAHSTSGRMDGWLGFQGKCICELSGGWTIWNSIEMDPYTARCCLQIVWWVLRYGHSWKTLKIPSGFGDIESRYSSTDGQVTFGRRERREGKVTSNWWWIRDGVWAHRKKVTSQSRQKHLSWLWLVGCWTATMTRHLASNSKPDTRRWDTRRSWVTSSWTIVAQKNYTV